MARGGGGTGGSSSSSASETLEAARLIGDSFLGDVYWDGESAATFGKKSSDLNEDYGLVYFDKAAHAFVFDSTKDGSGTIRQISWRMGGVEKMSLSATGALAIGGVAIDGAVPVFDSADGVAAALSAAGHGRLRYNDTLHVWQMSMNGGAYQTIAAGAANAFVAGGNTFGSDTTLGLIDNFVLAIGVNSKTWGLITDKDGTGAWTGPRLLIGATTAFFTNGDAIYIEKNIADQLGMCIRNLNSVNTANSGYYLVDDAGNIGGFNILNSGWPNDGSDTGCFPNEVALLTAGTNSNLVLGTTFANNKIRFIGFKSGVPGVAARELGYIQNNLVDQAVYWVVEGLVGSTPILKILSSGNSGATGRGAYEILENSDGQNGYFTLLESGAFSSFAGKNGYVTIAGTTGVGVRVNVNGANDSGWQINDAGEMTFFATKEGHFGAAPVAQQTGVAVTTAAIWTALNNLGFITA